LYLCTYNVNTMKKEKKKLYSIRIYPDQLNYLRLMADKNFTTVTQYVLDLIYNDMKNNSIKL
jgi:uncharacterized protein (DUF1778 family)